MTSALPTSPLLGNPRDRKLSEHPARAVVLVLVSVFSALYVVGTTMQKVCQGEYDKIQARIWLTCSTATIILDAGAGFVACYDTLFSKYTASDSDAVGIRDSMQPAGENRPPLRDAAYAPAMSWCPDRPARALQTAIWLVSAGFVANITAIAVFELKTVHASKPAGDTPRCVAAVYMSFGGQVAYAVIVTPFLLATAMRVLRMLLYFERAVRLTYEATDPADAEAGQQLALSPSGSLVRPRSTQFWVAAHNALRNAAKTAWWRKRVTVFVNVVSVSVLLGNVASVIQLFSSERSSDSCNEHTSSCLHRQAFQNLYALRFVYALLSPFLFLVVLGRANSALRSGPGLMAHPADADETSSLEKLRAHWNGEPFGLRVLGVIVRPGSFFYNLIATSLVVSFASNLFKIMTE